MRPSTSATWSATCEASIDFYTQLLGFELLTSAVPAFADVKRGNLRLLLAGPKSSAGRPMPDGATPGPGGWNRIHFIVDDLETEVARLRDAGATFRNDIVEGPGGKQILLLDPSGNVVELFQPAGSLTTSVRRTRPSGSSMSTTASLRRRLGVADAVTIGAGSMIGAGVFSAWGPAAAAAGTGLLIGLGRRRVSSPSATPRRRPSSPPCTRNLAARTCSPAASSAPFWGHLAGWGFVVGKTASCVALALTAGAYLWPEHARLVAVAAVGAVAIVNIGGLTRTVAVTKFLLAVALVALIVVVVAGWSSSSASLARLGADGRVAPRRAARCRVPVLRLRRVRPHRDTRRGGPRPGRRTIPRAITRALAGVLIIYVVIGVTLLATVPVGAISTSDAPLGLVVAASPLEGLAPVVRIGAGIAALGVLLNLVPGVSRTVLAMARRRELPVWLAQVDERRSVPLRAEAVVTVVVVVLTAALDLREAIGFSGVTILTYYAITNAACFTLPPSQRRWPRWISVAGLVGCVALAVALPIATTITGAAILLAGVVVRRLTRIDTADGRR